MVGSQMATGNAVQGLNWDHTKSTTDGSFHIVQKLHGVKYARHMLFLSAKESNDTTHDIVPEPIYIQHGPLNLGKLPQCAIGTSTQMAGKAAPV